MNNANDHNDGKGRCRIAITGGIGSGKSYICRMLENRGISIFNCDLVAKDIIAHDAGVRERLTRLVGGEPTRQRLGDYLRAGNGNDTRVNAIVHPRVAEAFVDSGQQWMECAILFESGFDRLVDVVVVVTCPEDERIRRIMARDNCSSDTARRWIALQTSDDERLRRANPINGDDDAFHIINDGTAPLEAQIDRLLQRL